MTTIKLNAEHNGFKIIKNRVSSKQKKFVAELLAREFALQALDSLYDSGEEKDFIATYKMTFKQAEEAIDAIVRLLDK